MGEEKSKSGIKTATVVAGAIAFAWWTIEIACKPFLNRARDAIAKSEPDYDPDDEEKSVDPPKTENSSGTK
ncbi:outer envelope membrane protein 7 [Zostera marina]|uniref:Outer envelope membrane protein 7 n=1 Tax=Zostera marina TaxID=29655 RepID=A0A0K9PT06_ZOSMR|nr:outer envelope membrane protein 7 [Zostera marina]